MVFGVFKKKASPEEIGHSVMHLAGPHLANDAAMSLGMLFPDWDGSDGWPNFLTRKGVTLPDQKLYFRFFSHCAIQAASTVFDIATRRSITYGAMVAGFNSPLSGYVFEDTYRSLEAGYSGQPTFGSAFESLTAPGATRPNFLPNSEVGVINAKFLLETFVSAKMQNREAFIENFDTYTTYVTSPIGTVRRAMDEVLGSFKMR